MPEDIAQLIPQIEQLHKEKKYQEIIDLLTDALLLEKNNALLYAWKGRAFERIKENELATQNASKALAINSNCALAYLVKGNVYCVKKEYDKAFADYNKVIELDPNFPIAYNNRGLVWNYKKEYDKAIADFDKAIELDPNYNLAYHNRGNVWYEKKEYDKAIADYNKAIELKYDPIWHPLVSRSDAFKAFAEIAKENSDFSLALDYIKKALDDIDEARKNNEDHKNFLDFDRTNLLEQRKLIYEAISSQATKKDLEETKKDVEAAKKKIDEQATETLAAFSQVEKLRDRMREQAEKFDLLAKNIANVESKFNNETLKLDALETFFSITLTNCEAKTLKAEQAVVWRNIFLMVISIFCVATIGLVIKNNIKIIENKSMMIYMVSLTAIVLTPFIWMLKLAIKKRNECLLLETEYRHKTALASSLYSFKETLKEKYTQETTAQAFNTIYGQNPCELLADDKSLRMKNKKEQEYPHVTLEIIQKTLPEIVDKVVKAVLNKKEEDKN